MRLFVAVNLPAEVRDALYDDAAALRAASPRVKWVAAPSLHVTLKFLGHQEARLIPDFRQTLEAVAARHASIVVETREFGAFPNFRQPRVVWVGMTGAEAWGALADDIDRSFAGLGIARETRPFRAHLTLGRVKDEMTAAEARVLETTAAPALAPRAFSIRTIDLMQSELGPGGSKYAVLAAVPLHARGT